MNCDLLPQLLRDGSMVMKRKNYFSIKRGDPTSDLFCTVLRELIKNASVMKESLYLTVLRCLNYELSFVVKFMALVPRYRDCSGSMKRVNLKDS